HNPTQNWASSSTTNTNHPFTQYLHLFQSQTNINMAPFFFYDLPAYQGRSTLELYEMARKRVAFFRDRLNTHLEIGSPSPMVEFLTELLCQQESHDLMAAGRLGDLIEYQVRFQCNFRGITTPQEEKSTTLFMLRVRLHNDWSEEMEEKRKETTRTDSVMGSESSSPSNEASYSNEADDKDEQPQGHLIRHWMPELDRYQDFWY
ncbi:hypothetical protein BS50DRAFT_667601, partial [Corynespora cassiicola Philippines]